MSTTQDYTEEDVHEVEVEVTDDEAESDTEKSVDVVSSVNEPEAGFINPPEAGSAAKPTPPVNSDQHSSMAPATKPPKVGKVNPSREVKSLKLKAPTPAPTSKLVPHKNPFSSFGAWSKTEISEINIEFPVLTGKYETTNELTRGNKPEARYWKAPVSFKYGDYTSVTMRFENCAIPHHTSSGYGSNYIYAALPGAVGDAFAAAGQVRAPTKVTETSLIPDPERWWKIMNNVEGKIGVLSSETNKFHPKSLATIFDSTQSGVTATLIISFFCKANTSEKEPLKPTTVRTVSAELVRGYIDKVGQNIQLPARTARVKANVQPVATQKDYANDDLMKRLQEMGL